MKSYLLIVVIFSILSLTESLPLVKTERNQSVARLNRLQSGCVEQNAIPKDSDTLPADGSLWYLDKLDGVVDNKYTYPKQAGEGIDVYVIDSGVHVQHKVFGGRASNLNNFVTDEENDDLNSHGTHGAGIVAMVAKKASTFGFKDWEGLDIEQVTDDTNTNSLLKGIKFAVEHIKKNKVAKSIINISVGSKQAHPADEATKEAIKAGIPVIIAAGNEFSDACKTSPTRADRSVISVANVKKNNSLQKKNETDRSNFGPCVGIAAYGTDILSAEQATVDGYRNETGTSMAAPVVSGLAAILLSMGIPAQNLRDKLRELSSQNTIVKGLSHSDSTLNKLLATTTPKIATLELIDTLKVSK